MESQERVALIVPNLLLGGAQRAIVHLFDQMDNENVVEVHLISLTNISSNNYNVGVLDVDRNRYNVHVLEFSKIRHCYLGLSLTLRRLRISTVLTTVTHVNQYILLMNRFLPLNVKIIVRETNMLSLKYKRSDLLGKIFSKYYNYLYSTADKIIAQSQDMKRDLEELYPDIIGKTIVINNPINLKSINHSSREYQVRHTNFILILGHLTKQKNHVLLIQIISNFPDVRLLVIGDGPEKSSLVQLAAYLGVDDRIEFLGFMPNPFPYLMRAKFIVLPSLYEGFPNVLLEALACGIPILANDCKGGIREIVTETNGLIFEYNNSFSLIEKFREMLHKDWDRNLIRANSAKFDLKSIAQTYTNVLIGRPS